MQKHTTGKTCSIAEGLTATTAPKTNAYRLWLGSRDARRTAPGSLLATRLGSDLRGGGIAGAGYRGRQENVECSLMVVISGRFDAN